MDPKELVLEYWKRFNAKDLEGVSELLSPDFEEHGPLGSHKGRKECVDSWVGMTKAFPDGKTEILNIVAEGNQVCVETRTTGTNTGGLSNFRNTEMRPASNKPLVISGCEVFEVEGGLITSRTFYYDVMQVRSQLASAEPYPATYPSPGDLYPGKAQARVS